MKISITEWERAKQAAANSRRGRRAKTTAMTIDAAERRKAMRKAYDKAHMVTVTMKLHKDYDADIIAKLESLDGSRQGYIKSLILADLEMEKAAAGADAAAETAEMAETAGTAYDEDEFTDIDLEGLDDYVEQTFD